MSCELPWYSRQRGVLSQRIDGGHAKIIDLIFTAKSPANGIYKRGTEGMGFFQANDLSPGGRVEQHCIEPIRRAIGSNVEQVSSRNAVLVRNLVISANRKEVLGDDSLTSKAEGRSIAV